MTAGLAHNCGDSRGLTPSQVTDLCPRCQYLLTQRELETSSTEELLDQLESLARQGTRQASSRRWPSTAAQASALTHTHQMRDRVRGEIIARLGAQYRAGFKEGSTS